MKNTFLGLLGAFWMMFTGVALVINFVSIGNDITQANQGYFGFMSLLKMFDFASFTLGKMSSFTDNWVDAFKTWVNYLSTGQNDFTQNILGVFIIPVTIVAQFLKVVWYILNVPAVLIICFIGAISGAFNTPHDYQSIEQNFPLMMSFFQTQFNLG